MVEIDISCLVRGTFGIVQRLSLHMYFMMTRSHRNIWLKMVVDVTAKHAFVERVLWH